RGKSAKLPSATIVLGDLPADSEVFVDDEKAALKPSGDPRSAEIAVQPGPRKLEIRNEGFKSQTQQLTVAANERTRLLVRLEPWKELTLAGHAGGVFSVAFSPDGQRIVTGSEDKTIKVWDADRGSELLTLRGHKDAVLAVAFSGDGRKIV